MVDNIENSGLLIHSQFNNIFGFRDFVGLGFITLNPKP